MAHQYVALLRGINVGTAKRIAMADLRSLIEGLGHGQVRTLLNSGNVVFTSSRVCAPDPAAVRIEKAIQATTGISSRVTVLSADDLAEIVQNNPLLKVGTDHSRLFVAISNQSQHLTSLAPLTKQKWGDDILAIGPRAAYMWCPDGMTDSPLAKALAKAMGDNVTTRNWATILKLQALLTKSEAD
jgi:uncharacterized protein (DUF1697 family)